MIGLIILPTLSLANKDILQIEVHKPSFLHIADCKLTIASTELRSNKNETMAAAR